MRERLRKPYPAILEEAEITPNHESLDESKMKAIRLMLAEEQEEAKRLMTLERLRRSKRVIEAGLEAQEQLWRSKSRPRTFKLQ